MWSRDFNSLQQSRRASLRKPQWVPTHRRWRAGDEVRWAMFCLAYNFKCSHFTSLKVAKLASHYVTPTVPRLSLSPACRTSLVGKIKRALRSLIKTCPVSNTILKAPLSVLWMPKSTPAHIRNDTFWFYWWQSGSDLGHWRMRTASHMAEYVSRLFPGCLKLNEKTQGED